MTGPRKLAQFSFIGFAPSLLLNVKDGKVTLHDLKYDERINMESRDPIQVIKAILGAKSENCDFRFVGGAVGYVSYDAIRYWEKIPNIALDDLGFPDFQMGIYSDGLIFDHLGGETLYFFRGEDRSNELSKLAKKAHNPGSLSYTDPKANIKQFQYERLVEKAKFYIASGDIFQVVLSKRYDFKIEGDLARFYVTLKKINPSLYMYFLKMEERKIVGSSPEMLVRVEGDTIETFPIAGTRPRVENPAENRALARNLLSDPKERVEHGMLTYILLDNYGQILNTHSVSAGLDYPGVGPEHSFLKSIGRAQYVTVDDAAAVKAFVELSRKEGIIPALEPSHALAYAMKLAETMEEDNVIVVTLSGRGDKDVGVVAEYLGVAI